MKSRFRIGVISDTHGVIHAAVPEILRGVDHIVHAGDVGGDHIIESLEKIAPVTFVRGNNDNDTGEQITRFELNGLRVLLTHVLPRPRGLDARVTSSLRREPADIVIFGHSHLPHDERVDDVWFFNPASAGPRRFDYPVSVGIIERDDAAWRGYHVALDERSVDALKKRMNQLSSHSER